MSNSKQLLESYKSRLIAEEEVRREAAANLKTIYAEMKSDGFAPAAMRKVIKEHFETEDQRAKREAIEEIADVYKANLGMLGGTPLGDAARKHLSTKTPDAADEAPEPGAEETIGAEQIDAARVRGSEDAKAGKKIFENPFTSGGPRRAAWDEGWCKETGTDGMELPDALKPKKKPKPDEKQDGKPDGGEGGEG